MARALLLALLLACGGHAAAAALPPQGTYVYTVTHPSHGEIGTYTNVVRREGDRVTVDTKLDLKVNLAFVTVYRETGDRREEWRDGRLVRFESRTTKNGKKRNVEGRADGDHFVVHASDGSTAEAPAGVWPMNPWSSDITKADAVLASSSGKVYPAQIVDAGRETIAGESGPVETRHYRVIARGLPYDLWFDRAGRVVKFTAVEDDEPIQFTLTGMH